MSVHGSTLIERYAAALAETLASADFRVTLVTGDPKKEEVPTEDRIARVTMPLGYGLFRYVWKVRYLHRKFKGHGDQVVHIHGLSDFWAVCLASRLARRRAGVVWSVHARLAPRNSERFSLLAARVFRRLTRSMLVHVICASEVDRRHIVRLLNLDPSVCSLIVDQGPWLIPAHPRFSRKLLGLPRSVVTIGLCLDGFVADRVRSTVTDAILHLRRLGGRMHLVFLEQGNRSQAEKQALRRGLFAVRTLAVSQEDSSLLRAVDLVLRPPGGDEWSPWTVEATRSFVPVLETLDPGEVARDPSLAAMSLRAGDWQSHVALASAIRSALGRPGDLRKLAQARRSRLQRLLEESPLSSSIPRIYRACMSGPQGAGDVTG